MHTEDQIISWLEAVARQDQPALRQLYDATSAKLFALALRILNNRDWAEDVLQDAYLQIWRSAGDYRRSLSPPLAWMGMIVRSRALDFIRRRNAERLDRTVELDDDLAAAVSSADPGPQDMALASEQAWALRQCLDKLEPRQRDVVSLAYLRELSHGELSEQLRIPLGTVKTWIRRGLQQLRVCMERFA